jgi:hypothetical protein
MHDGTVGDLGSLTNNCSKEGTVRTFNFEPEERIISTIHLMDNAKPGHDFNRMGYFKFQTDK